jgi:hypothetical protein
MKKLNLCVLLVVLAVPSFGQGTLVFDQESSSDEGYVGGGAPIQFYGTVGQSFTPSLSTVGFFRVKLQDLAPYNSLGATLLINLRSNAINGPILGTTTSVVLPDGFNGSTNFFLPTVVPVVPGTMYFFQVLVQSGDNVNIAMMGDVYSSGTVYGGNFPATGNDLWFREGVVVPEPTALALLGCGLGVWWIGHRGKSSRAR